MPRFQTALALFSVLIIVFVVSGRNYVTHAARTGFVQQSSGSVGFMSSSYIVNEGDGNANLTLSRIGGSSGRVVDGITFTNVTTSAADYGSDPGADNPAFHAGAAANSFVHCVGYTPDGKIFIAGEFTTVQGIARIRIARLNADGTLDPSFNPLDPSSNPGGPDGTVYSMAVQPDGKVIVGGEFNSTSGIGPGHLVRFNIDGSIDTSFAVFPNGAVYTLAIQNDGAVVMGGGFTTINSIGRSFIARATSGGTLDSGFIVNGLNNGVNALAIQPDGSILVGGSFTNPQGTSRNSLVRVSSSGVLDSTFNSVAGVFGTGANDLISTVALQSDNRIIIGGPFTTFNGTAVPRLARLNTDGSVDTSFNSGGAGAERPVQVVAVQPDDKVVIGGDFISYNGANKGFVARTNADGTLDATFGTSAGDILRGIAIRSDGKITIGGRFGGGFRQLTGNLFAVWQDGDSSDKIVQLPIVDDTIVESNETLNLGLTSIKGGATIGSFANATLTIVDNDIPPAVTSPTPPPVGFVGIAYSHTFTATGNPAPTFSVSGGTLPPGLQLNPSGALSGTPTAAGAFNSITVTASNGVSPAATQTFNIRVYGVNAPPVNHVPSSVTVFKNTMFSFPAGSFSVSDPDADALPVQVTLTATNGTLSISNITGLTFSAGTGTNDGAMTFTATLLAANSALSTLSFQPLADYTGSASIQITTNDLGNTGTGGPQTDTDSVNITVTPPSAISFTSASYSVSENVGNAIIPVTRTGGNSFPSIAKIKLTDVTTSSADYRFAPGTLDQSLVTSGANNSIFAVAPQPDGKLVAAGRFTTFNGVSGTNRIVRLNAIGSTDTTFTPGSGANGTIDMVKLLPDGSMYISGAFTSYAGTPRNRIAKLKSNGTLDTSFNPQTDGGPDGEVLDFDVAADGRVVVGGLFFNVGGLPRNGIARINTNGTVDATFDPGTSNVNAITSIAIQSDGKILAGGDFSPYSSTQNYKYIIRFNTDGTVDTSFSQNSKTDDEVEDIVVQPDGKILLAGIFTKCGGVNRGRIARLQSDGTLDTSFLQTGSGGSGGSPFGSLIGVMSLQPDGKILIAGIFTSYNGTSRNRVARINADGSLDTTFAPGTAANNTVDTVAFQSDGTIAIGGDFTSFNGTSARNRIARLNGDLFVSWQPGDSTTKNVLLPIVDDAIAESNETLRLDIQTFTPGTNPGNPATSILTIIDNDCTGAPVISQSPVDAEACPTSPVTFNVSATGTGLSYQWRKDTNNIPGANGPSYTIGSVVSGDQGVYDVVVSNTCGNTPSAVAHLIVDQKVNISGGPSPQSIPVNGTANFSVNATGSNLKFQWRKNGANLPTATSATFSIPNAQSGDAGTYDVVVQDGCGGTATSSSAGLVVYTPVNAGDILISEFRLSGPAGPQDEFVEIYNSAASAVTVGDASLGSGGGVGGWALVSSDDLITPKFVIPGGTIIPSRGHYLIANSSQPGGYSLASYSSGNSGAVEMTATPDGTYQADIPLNAGIALFSTANPSGIGQTQPLDAVGSLNESNASFRRGTGYSAIAPGTAEYSFVRDLRSGVPQNTGNNSADFLFVSTDGVDYGAGARLGAPGPENLASPIADSTGLVPGLVEPGLPATASPNRIRNTSPYTDAISGAGSFPLGTLTIRRVYSNNSGGAITKLRFRIIDVSTSPVTAGTADLRLLSSASITVTRLDGSMTVVQGLVLDQPPTQTIGGGVNSSVSCCATGTGLPGERTIDLQHPLQPGESIAVGWLLGAKSGGAFRFFVNVELLH